MRIGVLTYHWVYNFGANLQALATCAFLTRTGHEVCILNYRPQQLVDLYASRVPAPQADAHENFCDSRLPQSPLCRSEDELVQFCKAMRFDAILTGSDAVLRLSAKLDREDTRFPNPFWLTWANSGLRPAPSTAALAASAMGSNYFSYPHAVRRSISNALRTMTLVSVRDRWTQLMLFLISWGRCRPTLCPDPVIVLNDVFRVPDEEGNEAAREDRQYVLLSVYPGMLSDMWVREFVQIAHQHALQVYCLPLPEGAVEIPVDRVLRLPLPPLSWYSWIQHAAGFVGVRFHPVVCSMANEVPFVAFDTYQSGRLRLSSKTYDLCSRARTQSLCLSTQERRNLSPRAAFETLFDKQHANMRSYVVQARQDFSRTVSTLLAGQV